MYKSKVISFTSLKGGAGKTTLSINVATELSTRGYKVLLVDSDPNNQNCVRWSGFRDEELPKITTVGIGDASALRNNVREMKAMYDYVIIDGTPALEKLTGAILLISDLNILPLKPSTFDIWAFNDKFLPKYEEVRDLNPNIDCRIVLNSVNKRKRMSKMIFSVIEDYDITVMDTQIGNRTAFELSAMEGKGVVELEDEKAAEEIRSLVEIIDNVFNEVEVA